MFFFSSFLSCFFIYRRSIAGVRWYVHLRGTRVDSCIGKSDVRSRKLRFLCPRLLRTRAYRRKLAHRKKTSCVSRTTYSSELTFHAPDGAASSSTLSPLRSSQISVSAINTRVFSSLINFTSSQLRERRSSNSSDQCNFPSYLLEFLKTEKQRTVLSVCQRD